MFIFNWILGSDFTNVSVTLTIPPAAPTDGTQIYDIPAFFTVLDDMIDEDDQSFALLAEIGDDVPFNCYMEDIGLTDCSCFQLQNGDTECFGRRGATEIIIVDNDSKNMHNIIIVLFVVLTNLIVHMHDLLRNTLWNCCSLLIFIVTLSYCYFLPMFIPLLVVMVIGFTQRRQTVSESDADPGQDLFLITIGLATMIKSDRIHTMLFRIQDSSAIVEPLNQEDPAYDAIFGTRNPNRENAIEVERDLEAGVMDIIPLTTSVRNDFGAESEECYTISISPLDIPGARELFMCKPDDDNSTNYFCRHTICIEDDDGMYVKA